MKIDGGCHCGFITFEAEADPEKAAACHCTDCQTLSGSPFRTLIIVPKENFTLLSGQPRTYVKTGHSGRPRAQTFCPQCGSPLYATGVGTEEKFYNIRLGIVRQCAELPPKVQFWCRSALPWVPDIDGARKMEQE